MDYIAYEGLCRVSLAALQSSHGPSTVTSINKRVDINGTMQRAPYDPQGFEDWLSSLRNSRGKDEVFAVLKHLDADDVRTYEHIGNAGIHGIKWPDGYGTTGSMLFEPQKRGNGEGTEAKLLMLYHCFTILGLRKVCSSVKSFNAPSLGHLLKCGFKIVGRRKAHDYHEGNFVDEILLEVFPHEWKPIWEKYQKTGTLPKLTSEQRELVNKETNV